MLLFVLLGTTSIEVQGEDCGCGGRLQLELSFSCPLVDHSDEDIGKELIITPLVKPIDFTMIIR